MANLFWGVCDALDLYEEYINAIKQAPPKKNTEKLAETGATSSSNSRNSSIPIEEIKRADSPSEFVGDDVKNEEKNKLSKEETVENYDPLKANSVPEKNENNQFAEKPVAESIETTQKAEDLVQNKPKLETTVQTGDVQHSDNVDSDIKSSEIGHETKHNTKEVLDLKIEINNEIEESNQLEDQYADFDSQLTFRIDTIKIKSEIKVDIPNSQDLKETVANREKNKDQSSNEVNTNLENSLYKTPERQKAGEEQKSIILEESSPIIDKDPPNSCNNPNISNQESGEAENSKPRVLNILIFGGGDPRHIIKTMAKRYTHRQDEGTASSVPTLKFYIIEGCMEIVARNIALLGIALERPELISLRNKVHLFMDVYGNSLLRPICHQYLVSKAVTLLKMVSDNETLEKIAPFLHIDKLKYREIDALQDAFEFWQPKPGYDFNIKDYWTGRIRQLLAVRYDSRNGVFDWDLNMSLKDRGGQQICSQEYRYWRETGIAFTFPEYEQCKPNKTLSAGLVRNGGRYIHRGYIGDIQTGPFCTFGLRSMEERMHRSAHGENDYRATDVTERNLLEYFHEIQSGTPYVHNNALSHKYGGVRFQMGERLIHEEFDMKNICAYDQPWINVEGIEVHYLPLQEVKKIGKGASKWEDFFDVAFVGYKFFEFVRDEFPKVLRENGLLLLETKLRSVEVKNRISEFETELLGFARDAKLLNVLNYNALNSKNSILKFLKPEKSAQEKFKNIN